MLNVKRIVITSLIIVFIIILIMGVNKYLIKNDKENNVEIIPEEEISDEQMRQTVISLYFKSGDKLVPEARLIDVKKLLNNPYEEILNMLLYGPKNENLEKIIPEKTKVNKIEKKGDILIIDFSDEFINNKDNKDSKLIIDSIVNTFTELTEINGIKILINGEENREFSDGIVKFNNIFEKN